jgi:hypothetical protein
MYVVNKTTMMFDALELTAGEVEDIYELCKGIILHNKIDYTHPAFVAWAEGCELSVDHQLCTYHTTFPQRALLSITSGAVDH